MSLVAFGDTILVECEPIQSSYQGSLILPDLNSQWEQVRWGKIVGIGKGCKHSYLIGQRVMCPKVSGAKFKYEEKDYVSYRESELDMTWVEQDGV